MNSDLRKFILLVAVLISGCKNSFDEPVVSPGNADFTSYVALGGYFTAGFGDGALHHDLQTNSFPAILASRFAMAGGGAFKQPMVNPGNGLGFDESGNLISRYFLTLQTNCAGNPDVIRTRSNGDASNLNWIGPQGPYNNMGVPGIKVFDLFSDKLGQQNGINSNKFFSRFAWDNSTGTSSTVIDDADRVNPTFFTFWIGSEDLWTYARSGGAGEFLTDTLIDVDTNDITPIARYRSNYMSAVAQLTDNNEKGALATIPDIEDIPYFTAIPYNGLELTQAEAEALNAVSSNYNFHEGANSFIITIPNSSNARQIQAGEFILLNVPADSILCYGMGTPQHPIPHHYVLDSSEVANIYTATAAYNGIISAAANSYDLALVDMHQVFKQFTASSVFNGATYTTQFLRKSIFSSDGLYPNARGNAHIANAFIRAINAKYLSTIPEVDVNSYPGNILP